MNLKMNFIFPTLYLHSKPLTSLCPSLNPCKNADVHCTCAGNMVIDCVISVVLVDVVIHQFTFNACNT